MISIEIFDHGQTAAIPLKYLTEEEYCGQIYFQGCHQFLGCEQVQTQEGLVWASHIIISQSIDWDHTDIWFLSLCQIDAGSDILLLGTLTAELLIMMDFEWGI